MAAISYGVSLGRRRTTGKLLGVATHVLLIALSCSLLSSCFAIATAAPSSLGMPTSKELKVYFVDVEGGQATLFVTQAGESLLIDTGWPGNDGRDADRIVAAAKDAGITKIDYVLITHFHDDHVGGLPQLVARIPVGTFIDHGDNREVGNAPTLERWQAYQQLLATGKYKRLTLKPGDKLPVKGIDATVVSSDGALIDKPLLDGGAGRQNASCKESERRAGDQTENPRSLGIIISYGKLRFLDLGDLTRDKEMELMCPLNRLGRVDVYIVSHHGWQQSGSPALVHGIAPSVAIMDNGAKKGRIAFGVGHHQVITTARRFVAVAFFRGRGQRTQCRAGIYRQSSGPGCRELFGVDSEA